MKKTLFMILMVTSISLADLPLMRPGMNPWSLLSSFKTDNLKINHSYSMVYSSGSWNSGLTGRYLNQFQYQFKIPLKIDVTWGIEKSFSGFEHQQNPRFVLPQFRMTAQPWKNVWIQFEYRQIQTPFGGPTYWYDDPNFIY